MRRRWIMATALALTGCGARSSLWVPEPEPGKMEPYCGRFGIILYVGATDCNEANGFLAIEQPGVEFSIAGTDYPKLQSGAVFEITDDFLPPTAGYLSGDGDMLTGGTLEVTTYVAGESATGSYDVQFVDGERSGSFSVVACPEACAP
jgi:hypothetical protein